MGFFRWLADLFEGRQAERQERFRQMDVEQASRTLEAYATPKEVMLALRDVISKKISAVGRGTEIHKKVPKLLTEYKALYAAIDNEIEAQEDLEEKERKAMKTRGRV